MATVTTIATAIKTQLLALSDVDYASVSEFAPAISSATVAAFVVPFEQESNGEFLDLAGTSLLVRHRIRCEFWVKHTQGAVATTMQLARDICTLAMIGLMQTDGTGYDLDTESAFDEIVSDTFVQVDSVPYLVAALVVPVRNEITL